MENDLVLIDEVKLLEQMLDDGISSVGVDLEKKIGKAIVFADNYGNIFYFSRIKTCKKAQALILEMPVVTETEYYYRKKEGLLFYQLGEKQHKFVVVIEDVKQEDIFALIEEIRFRKLSLKTYIDMQCQSQNQAERFEKNLVETLVKSSANIHDIIGLHNIDLKTDQYYGILLISVENTSVNLANIAKFVSEICNRMEPMKVLSPILWNNAIVVIISAIYAPSIERDQTELNIEFSAKKWKAKIEDKFGIEISCGIGQFYMLASLHKSYIEAKIALAFPQLVGKHGTVQSFDNLGVFSMIFSQDIGSLKEYALKTLGPILNYDGAMNMQLLDTLRTLLNNGFHWTKTSKVMFVHVNTIHYRYDKIEKMLNLDLSGGKDRGNVFAALKVWDVLNKIGFIADGFPDSLR
jgi:sugar diacid utilization regulator